MKSVLLVLSAQLLCLTLTVCALSLPPPATNPRPLVLWHGMGDTHASPGILEFLDSIKTMHPGIFVHSIYLNEDADEDRRAGYFGNVNEQVANVSLQLASIPELKHGFDAIGFSQGGQFLRSYVEKYNVPPVHNLITFGSQHMGISDIPACKPWDLLCQLARRAARGGVYTEFAQANVVQAQYFRDQDQLPLYLERNHFLASINNEVGNDVNATYAQNLASLNKLVLALFTEDQMVIPKESAWFGSYAPAEDADVSAPERKVISMQEQPIYLDDRIGLKSLDERKDIVFWTCEGEHMHLNNSCWKPLIRRYVGEQLDLLVDPSVALRIQ